MRLGKKEKNNWMEEIENFLFSNSLCLAAMDQIEKEQRAKTRNMIFMERMVCEKSVIKRK